MTQPLLLIPVYRGGDRFLRCLRSLEQHLAYFDRTVLSINACTGSEDEKAARAFAARHSGIEVIVTGLEMTSFEHTRFWVAALEGMGVAGSQPIFWLAHDDELNGPGLACVGTPWQLDAETTYLGPWIVRHESVESLWHAPEGHTDEVWTCFRRASPQRTIDWVRDQLDHPTYISFSGCVFPLAGMVALLHSRPRKASGMRIEMSMAAAPGMLRVAEFPVPLTVVYGRADSDRATIDRRLAQRDELHLLYWVARYSVSTSGARAPFAAIVAAAAGRRIDGLRGRPGPGEEWLVRR